MTDMPTDPMAEIQEYAAANNIEIFDWAEVQPEAQAEPVYEPIPDYAGEPYVMPDDAYEPQYEDDAYTAQFGNAEDQGTADLERQHADLERSLGRPMTDRETERLTEGVWSQLERGHDPNVAAAFYDELDSHGETANALADDASIGDMTKWATERYRDLSREAAPAAPSQAEVDRLVDVAEGSGPEAIAAMAKIAMLQLNGEVGLREPDW